MNRYVHTPDTVSYNEVVNSQYKLSSSLFLKLVIPNANSKKLADFLSRKLERSDLGVEVGSLSYIDKSPKYFLRTKALQDYSYIPELTSETMLPILPKDFVNMNLKRGDIIISKDSNIGEVVILDKDYPNCMLSGALYKLPLKEEWKYYLLAFIKHDIFREQLNAIVPKGATIRHAKTLFLDCLIPLPISNAENVVKYVSLLTEAIVNKQVLIKQRHAEILRLIDEELHNNQKEATFAYGFPNLKDLIINERLDVSVYSPIFQEQLFLITNYNKGYKNIYDWGFTLSRGQNLQVSNIGVSIYTTQYHKNFYELMLPKFLSKFGTISQVEYLGNPKKLKTLKQGDLIFGAEGFEKGRSIVVLEEQKKTITNIHGITIQQKENDITKAIFIKCFLDFLRSNGMIDSYAVGGNGGSLAQKYWDVIPFPNFPEDKQKEIAALYHNPQEYLSGDCTLDDFLAFDDKYNATAGIYELDKTAKYLQQLLNQAIDDIVNNREVEIKF